MGKLEQLIKELTIEHTEQLKKVEDFKKRLDKEFSVELVEEILNFFKTEVENHAIKEEEDLINEIEKVAPEFDTEAIVFGHNTLREAIEDLEATLDEYKKGKASEEKVKKFANQLFTILKDHFVEEENFLFPDLKKYDIEI
ncbi:MAG: hemerythrin domain-containing protein [Aquificota bacterium]|nr:MAG: hemerythrin domain-containing protein [Aquificota bacterium]